MSSVIYEIYEITRTKRSLWEPEEQTSKASNSTKQNLTYDDFTCVFSIAVNCFFLRHPKNLPFGIISYSL